MQEASRARIVGGTGSVGAQSWREHLRDRQSIGRCSDLFALWLEHLERNGSKSDTRSAVKTHPLPAFGSEQLSDLST